MKRHLILTLSVLFAFITASAQSDEAKAYLVKTKGPKKTVAAAANAADATAEAEQESATDFIGSNFKYYSLCDWKPGMKFMVLPEKYDLVVKTFTDASTGREVSSMGLRYKIMVYQGHNSSSDGHDRINFRCQDDNKMYYYEIPSGQFEDYCYDKRGVPTLAYLGDVDIAKEKLMDKTLFTKTRYYRVDTENDGDGFREVTVPMDSEVKVTKIGVGTRSFPVKIVFEDKDGVEYYMNVAISKTNSGMRDDEFTSADSIKHLFSGAFELQDDIMAVTGFNYQVFIGRIVHTKHPTKMLNETTKKIQAIPRMAEYQVESITPHKNDDKATLKLKNTTLGTFFYMDVVLEQHRAENEEDYFGYLFAAGPGKKVETTEGNRAMIRAGHVGIGFTEDEVEMAAGEADKKVDGVNGIYTWIYNRSNDKLLFVEFDGSRTVTKTYTKDDPNAPKKKAPAKSGTSTRRTTVKRSSSSSGWQSRKGTPL